jgi:hypothetical protein
MSRNLKHIDAIKLPDVLRIAEEVQRTQEPRLIKRGDEELAVVSPISPTIIQRGRPTTLDDSLWNIIGIGRSKGPTDTSANKHKYLAEAYSRT